MMADIDDEEIGYFLERNLFHVVGEYELSGIVNGMIATGFRDPDIPLFCVLNENEYCISKEYTASNRGIFHIFKMVKQLKQIIKNELLENLT